MKDKIKRNKMKDKMTEYVKIENPDIFALKDDFESGKLFYRNASVPEFVLLTGISELACYCQFGALYKKQNWTDKLDGTEENGVWCEVYHLERNKAICIELIKDFRRGHSYPYKGLDTWGSAEPVPQEMVDFINRK